ncbi:MAG TPA: amidohydrolase family protein [bacterium]|nr:amidohydrolase family protein [bacterium]
MTLRFGWTVLAVLILGVTGPAVEAYEVNDVHFHITNYVQEGTEIHKFLEFMGDKVGRVALFGIPLQQTWDYDNSGNYAPTYYLHSDAPLYYYSFTDAVTAMTYKSLTPEEQARFDPMITGFNPADMYGVDHIKRVLKTFPGVFEGIGEFTIHKEFVSSKTAGGPASLIDPAIDRIFKFAEESGLLVLIHSDIDRPFAKKGDEPVYLNQMKSLLKRHRGAKIIWAHMGLGRVVHPVEASEKGPDHFDIVRAMLNDGSLKHVSFDISWDEVAKYILATPEATKRMADLINRSPDRFLFGSDVVAPTSQKQYLEVYDMYAPLWSLLTPEASEKVRKKNYERLFDEARRKVRAWEKAHLK